MRSRRPADRVVRAPLSQATRIARGPARDRASGSGRIVTHREFVAPVSAPDGLYNILGSYVLNPSNPTLFPWLSTIALKYETYRFLSLRFVYVARTSATTTGSVILSPEYDPDDPPPADLQAALTSANSIESVPWTDAKVNLPSTRLHSDTPRKFNRRFLDTSPASSKYDAGIMHFATEGINTTSTIGHIWVEYSVSLETPQLSASIASRVGSVAQFLKVAPTPVPANLDAEDMHVLAPILDFTEDTKLVNGTGVTSNPTDGNFTFPKGQFKIRLSYDYEAPKTEGKETIDTYTFLQPFLTIDGKTQLGPCIAASGNTAGTNGLHLAPSYELVIALTVPAIINFGLHYINAPRSGALAPTIGAITALSNILVEVLKS